MTITTYADGTRGPLASPTTQATAVEQSRAIAEVQAAVVVAQQCPRDLTRAEAEVRDACSRLAVAERAFFAVPNRGEGMSVHLARELARIWGNVQYGVRELRRDDDEGVSEIEIYAWDCQANVRPSRTVQVPHARMKGGRRQKLMDLGDIVNNNNNVGARQLRECIKAVIPDWFSDLAESICRETLDRGDGKPIAERVAKMLDLFAAVGISQAQIEARAGKPVGKLAPQDLAKLSVAYTSITSDGIDPASIFPPIESAAPAASALDDLTEWPATPAIPERTDHA